MNSHQRRKDKRARIALVKRLLANPESECALAKAVGRLRISDLTLLAHHKISLEPKWTIEL
jgi:hypothetical protein